MVAELPTPDWAARMVDLRGLAQPETFSDKPEDWLEWKFRFTAVMQLVGIGPYLEFIPRLRAEPIPVSRLTPEERQLSRVLYNILLQCLRGNSLALLRLVADSNGFEVWRLLLREFEPADHSRYAAMLIVILRPQWSGDVREFEGELRRWAGS